MATAPEQEGSSIALVKSSNYNKTDYETIEKILYENNETSTMNGDAEISDDTHIHTKTCPDEKIEFCIRIIYHIMCNHGYACNNCHCCNRVDCCQCNDCDQCCNNCDNCDNCDCNGCDNCDCNGCDNCDCSGCDNCDCNCVIM